MNAASTTRSPLVGTLVGLPAMDSSVTAHGMPANTISEFIRDVGFQYPTVPNLVRVIGHWWWAHMPDTSESES